MGLACSRGLWFRCSPWVLVVLFGLVSLFADVAYEGGRSILPPYMTRVLGATIVVLGVGIGLAEFIGFTARLLAGFLADLTRGYWVLVFLGYALVYMVPFLALAWNPYVALVLFVFERFGKAIRSPARDALLSSIPSIGKGMVFGIHELLDQLGAVIGPGLASLILLYYGDYRLAYIVLGVSVTLALITLGFAKKCWSILGLKLPGVPRRRVVEGEESGSGRFTRLLALYLVFVFLAVAALVPYQIMLYVAEDIVAEWVVPLIYLVAQGVDAGAALVAGYSFDRYGAIALVPALAVTPITAIALSYSYTYTSMAFIVATAVFYGVAMGYHESVFRALLSKLVPLRLRGTGYGLYYTSYGLGLVVAGYAVSVLYVDLLRILLYSTVLVACALAILLYISRRVD